jgi:hypothetical protein
MPGEYGDSWVILNEKSFMREGERKEKIDARGNPGD